MKNSPSNRFREWILNQIELLPPNTQLPTDRDLARQWDLSERTVRTVLNSLRDENKVLRVRGKGSFTPPQPNAPPPEDLEATPSATAAENLYAAIWDSIRKGEIRRGDALPPVKLVCGKFHVSPSTVRQAYRRLTGSGHVTRVGNTFWVGSFTEMTRMDTRKEVYLFNSGSPDFGSVFDSVPFSTMLNKALEELSYHGFLVRFHSIDDLQTHCRKWIHNARLPHGIILWGMDEQAYSRVGPPLERAIRKAKDALWPIPAVVLQWHSKLERPVKGFEYVLRGSSSTMAARTLANYLVNRRARSVTVLLDGHRTYNPDRGSFWGTWPILKIWNELQKLKSDMGFRLVVCMKENRLVSPAEYFDMIMKYQHPAYVEKALMGFWAYADSAQNHRLDTIADPSSAFSKYRDSEFWVCSTDGIASQALDWTRIHNVRVPEEMKVIGLENNPRFFHLGISSCFIDWGLAGYQLAHAVIRDFPVKHTGRGFIRVGAKILDRLTT